MKSPSIKISVESWNYSGVRTLGSAVIMSMTSNANFPAPSPALATLQTAVNELSDAITAWGTAGHRGSKIDLAKLRIASINLLNLLKLEAAYVTRLVNRDTTPTEQLAFILSSGFEPKKDAAPQGVLQAPQNLHQVINQRYSPLMPKMKWMKPQGLLSRKNVKLYEVYRGENANFSDAVIIGTTVRTSFIDTTAPRGATQYYFVRGLNTAGSGVPCDGVMVPMPN